VTAVVQGVVSLTSGLDLAIVGKATIVLALGLAVLPLASRARASVRHLLMAATFGTVLVLPLVISTVPAVVIPVPLPMAERVASLTSNEAFEVLSPANAVRVGDNTKGGDQRSRPSFATLIRSVWAAGTMLLLVLLAIDLRRLRALRRGGLPWPAQNNLTRSVALTSGVHRSVDVLLHEGVSAPLTCGLWRPAILLPVDASDWCEADLRRALLHELEHVRRGDWATQLTARVVCACYWFHPLVWMAWGRLCLEAERACDDAVVQRAECTDYAEQLVSLARRLSTARGLPSLAMANRTDLSARVVALLDGSRRRGRVGRKTTASVVSVAFVLVLVVASVRAVAAPTQSPEAVHAPRLGPIAVVAQQLPDPGVTARNSAQARVTRANPGGPKTHRTPRPIAEQTTEWRDSSGFAESTRSVIDGPLGRSASAERTVIHSVTGSGSATHSGTSSSSSDNTRQ
jgi:bla regulator protein BlaR1